MRIAMGTMGLEESCAGPGPDAGIFPATATARSLCALGGRGRVGNEIRLVRRITALRGGNRLATLKEGEVIVRGGGDQGSMGVYGGFSAM